MHELTVAAALVEQIEEIRKRENAERVCAIYLSLGELSGIDREAFEFCFPLAAEGTAVEKAQIVIEEVKTVVHCSDCELDTEAALPFLACTACGSLNISVSAGQDFLITSVELE